MLKIRSIKRMTAAFLLVFVVFSFVFNNQTLAFAAQQSQEIQTTEQTGNIVESQITADEPTVEEVQGMRTEFSKMFKNSDGSMKSIVTAEPQNYYNGGKWEAIDNSLVEKSINGRQVYTNKANDFIIELPKTVSSENEVKVQKGQYEISFCLAETESINAQLIGNPGAAVSASAENAHADLSSAANLDKLNSGISYEDVLSGTDIRYDITAKELKESIILKDSSAIREKYVYEVAAKGLTAELLQDNFVSFCSEKGEQAEFMIPAPYMSDSSDEQKISTDIDVELESLGNGRYLLTYLPSLSWLEDESIQFPVTIDPTVKEGINVSSLETAYINLKSPNTNYSGNDAAYLSLNELILLQLKNTVPSMEGFDVERVSFNIILETTSESTVKTAEVEVREIPTTFNVNTVTSNNMPSAQPVKVLKSFEAGGTYRFYPIDVTESWERNGNNFCIELSSKGLYTKFRGYRETYYGASLRPYVEIIYKSIFSGIDEDRSYHSINMGRAGTVNIDDATGNLVLVREDVSSGSEQMPFSFQSITDSRYRKYMGSSAYIYKDTISNMNVCIRYVDVPDDSFYMLVDEKGAVRILKKSENTADDDSDIPEGAECWSDLSGYKLIRTQPSNGKNNYGNAYLKTPLGKKIEFSAANSRGDAYAAKISNINQPKSSAITIARDSDSKKIIGITNATGITYTFTYDSSSGYLKTVKYTDGGNVQRTITYGYTNNNLTSIQYPDAKTVRYTYDSNGNIASVQDTSGIKLNITYDSQWRVTKLQKANSIGTLGNYINITYDNLVTTFTDNKGKKEIEQFDNNGFLRNILNGEGKPIYRACGIDNLDLTTDVIEMPEEENLIQNSDFSEGGRYWSNVSYCSTGNQSGVPDSYAKFRNSPKSVYINQTVSVSAKKGDKFVFSAWARPQSVINAASGEVGDFALKIKAYDVDDPDTSADESNNIVELASIKFNPYVSRWQFLSGEFTLKRDQTSIFVYFQYDYKVNPYDTYNVDVSNITLQKNPEYDYVVQSGNLVKVETEPTDNKEADEEKDAYGRVVKSTSKAGYTTHTVYDSYGNKTREYISDNGVTLGTSRTYDSNGNFITSSFDAEGNKTMYSYDSSGNLKQITLPNGVKYNYSYDSMGRMAKESVEVTGQSDGYSQISNQYTYDGDKIKKITNNNCTYELDYDNWGNQKSYKVGSNTLEQYTYTNPSAGQLGKIVYANGQNETFTYDANGNVTGIKYNGDTSDRYTLTYENNKLKSLYDRINNTTAVYHTDGLVEEYSGNGTQGTLLHKYYLSDNVWSEKIGGYTAQTDFVRDEDGYLLQSSYNSGSSTAYSDIEYDAFGRPDKETVHVKDGGGTDTRVLWSNNTYSCYSGKTGLLIESKEYQFGNGNNDVFNYSYDSLGNITEIERNSRTAARYTYDEAGRLIRSDEAAADRTYVYQYDSKGNITSRKVYAYTTGTPGSLIASYDYQYNNSSWCDLLTSYDRQTITYDSLGNPLAYGSKKFTWQGGRVLQSLSDGTNEYNYTYNIDDIRTSKTVRSYTIVNGEKVYGDTKTINYTLAGNLVTSETDGESTIYYRYDGNGELISLNWMGEDYFYQKDIQGNIVGILDKNGNPVVQYSYDAWGNPAGSNGGISGTMADTLGKANPFRYRGYYYDSETGLYYLNSRYYNPQWGRFLNSDSILINSGLEICPNLFVYCKNNPVMYIDPTGYCSSYNSAEKQGQQISDMMKNAYKGSDRYVAQEADRAREMHTCISAPKHHARKIDSDAGILEVILAILLRPSSIRFNKANI